ncbi:N-acetyltransferase [Puteibacter caeruleilacunae]|nr:N-acetyltransferase [Puteibacter caeruleilacunae]
MNDILKGEKIQLRPLEPEDIHALYQWENDSSIWNVSNTMAPFSRYILTEYIKNSGADIFETKQLRLIIANHDGEPLGAIDLFDFDPYHLRAGLGILIYQKEDRKNGYASEAINMMKEYAQKVLGLHQLYANVTVDNTASVGLFEKCGFETIGTKKDWIKTYEGWKDEHLMQVML